MAIGLVAAIIVAQVRPTAWQRQSLTPAYSVETPVKLKPAVNPTAKKTMPKGMLYWVGKFEAALYSAMSMPVTDADRKLVTPPLEAFSQGMARPGGGAITWKRTLSLPGGLKGLEWDQENRLMKARWRAYLVKDRILAAAVTWRTETMTPFAMARYLDSMRIKP